MGKKGKSGKNWPSVLNWYPENCNMAEKDYSDEASRTSHLPLLCSYSSNRMSLQRLWLKDCESDSILLRDSYQNMGTFATMRTLPQVSRRKADNNRNKLLSITNLEPSIYEDMTVTQVIRGAKQAAAVCGWIKAALSPCWGGFVQLSATMKLILWLRKCLYQLQKTKQNPTTRFLKMWLAWNLFAKLWDMRSPSSWWLQKFTLEQKKKKKDFVHESRMKYK